MAAKHGHDWVVHPLFLQRHPVKRLRQSQLHAQCFSQKLLFSTHPHPFSMEHGPSWSHGSYLKSGGEERERERERERNREKKRERERQREVYCVSATCGVEQIRETRVVRKYKTYYKPLHSLYYTTSPLRA